jgi:hypothetical protein
VGLPKDLATEITEKKTLKNSVVEDSIVISFAALRLCVKNLD